MSDADCTPGREPRSVAASSCFVVNERRSLVCCQACEFVDAEAQVSADDDDVSDDDDADDSELDSLDGSFIDDATQAPAEQGQ